MTPIQRMKNRKEALIAVLAKHSAYIELQEIERTLATIDRFTDDDPAEKPITHCKPKRKRNGHGKGSAINDAIADAIAKYNRPVTLAEIFEETAKYGYSKSDYGSNVATHIHCNGTSQYKYYHSHGGYWHKYESIPDKHTTALEQELKAAGAL